MTLKFRFVPPFRNKMAQLDKDLEAFRVSFISK